MALLVTLGLGAVDVAWGRVGLGRTVVKLGRAVLGKRVPLVLGAGRTAGLGRLAFGIRLAGITATRTVPVLVLGRGVVGGTRVSVAGRGGVMLGRTGGRAVLAGLGRGLLAELGSGRAGVRAG